MGSLLLLRGLRGLRLLEPLLPGSCRSLWGVQCICSSAACSTSTSTPSSGPEALRQQQQQQQQDIWERKYQRRIVRRRPKGLLNPYEAAAAQHMPDAQRIASTVWQAAGSSPGMSSLKQSMPQSYFNSSSSSDQHAESSQFPAAQQLPTMHKAAANSWVDAHTSAAAAAAGGCDAEEEAAAAAAAAAAAVVENAADVDSPGRTVSGTITLKRVFARQQISAADYPEFEVVPRHSQPVTYSRQQPLQQGPGSSSVSSSSDVEILTVVAVHVGGEVDFQAFCKEFNFKDRVTTLRDHVLLEVDELNEERVLFGPGREEQRDEKKLMVIFRYGSVIFFNLRQRSRDAWLDKLAPFIKVPEHYRSNDTSSSSSSSNGGIGPQRRTDETSVVIRSSLDEAQWACLEPDRVVVRALDVGNVRTISHVLGQSVALDYYNSKVDEAIQNFSPYLKEVAESGAAHRIKEKQLLQHIADNSLLYTDVVTKIGLLDVSQTAWAADRYCKLWEALRTDYEIEKRFEAINRKLGPMIENAKFLLDIRAEKKSAEAEWIIIGLICLEVVVNCYGHFML